MKTETAPSTENLNTTLVVLGKNIGEEWTGDRIRKTRHHLSPHSRVSVLAAGVALKEGLADNVIFTVANTSGNEPLSEEDATSSKDPAGAGLPLPSEAELMQAQFRRIFPNLADKVSTQPNSWDTNTDAKETKKLVKDKKISEKFKLMTVGFHKKRAKFLFNRVGLKPETLSSEDILARRRPSYAQAYKYSELYRREQKKEKRVYMIQRMPFAADLITKITKRSRS